MREDSLKTFAAQGSVLPLIDVVMPRQTLGGWNQLIVILETADSQREFAERLHCVRYGLTTAAAKSPAAPPGA